MDPQQFKKLIDKYLNGTASPAEKLEVENWFNSSDRKQGIIGFLSAAETKSIEKRLFESINKRIDAELNLNIVDIPQEKVRHLNFKRWMIAASILLLAGLFWVNQYDGKPVVKATEWVSIKAGKSAMKNVILPDGSSVWINAESSIRFKKKFNSEIREIWLDGEGYFDIVHDEKHAFEVHSGVLTTHILGTAFNVEAYAEDKQMSVSVVRGKVAVGTSRANLAILLPDDQLIYEKGSSKHTVRKVKGGSIAAWTTGKLVFKEETFNQIALKLERWYNIKVDFSNKEIGKCRLTASFDMDVPIENVLRMLCKVSGRKSVKKISNSAFLIKGKACNM